MTAYRVGVPAPRSEHSSCACSSCACCAGVRADLVDAALDIADAYRSGGADWTAMTCQQPLHPSMQRLLDAGDTLDHRHHREEIRGSERAMLEADRAAARVGGLFPLPAQT